MPERLSGIYGILPADLDLGDLLERAEAALRGGVRILQLRDKKQGFKKGLKRAQALRTLTRPYGARLIINDSLQLALESEADGVHLGRGDDAAGLSGLRSKAGGLLTGITCRADAAFAKFALDQGADYVSFGAIWPTRSKPEVPAIGLPRLIKARQMFPDANICAIGGITSERLPEVRAAGADCAAVISGLFTADDIEAEARAMVEAWKP